MKLRQLPRLGASLVLTLSSLLSISMPIVQAAPGSDVCSWSGGGGDFSMNNASNWTNCSSGVPVTGDVISFGALTPVAPATSTSVILVNDLDSAVELAGISVVKTATTNYTYYTLPSAKLAAGALLQYTGTGTADSYLTFSDTSTLTALGDLTIGSGLTVSVVTANIAGNVTLNGLYSGLTIKGAGSISGTLTIGDQQSVSLNPAVTTSSIAVQKGGTLSYEATTTSPTVSAALSLGGGSGTAKPQVNFFATCDTPGYGCTLQPTTWAVSSPVTLTADAYFLASDKSTVNFTGSLAGPSFVLTNAPYSDGSITFSPSSNTSSSTSGPQVNPEKKTVVSDDQSSTDFSVYANETLVVDGKAGNVNLAKGASLEGTGQVAGLYAATGSTVSPGHSPGCITSTGDIVISGTYKVDVGGTVACDGYDQLKVTGTVDLTGSTLSATLYNGFVPAVGQAYTIIENDGTDAITGEFTGIADGGTYTNDGVTYSVTYKGGDGGNDVILTVTAVDASKLPAAPNTGIKLVAAHPMASLFTSMTAAGLLFAASRRSRTVRR
ncbi:MAG: hypothetical protein ABIV43_03920 [Candidatus Saccharimonadales bacterium]